MTPIIWEQFDQAMCSEGMTTTSCLLVDGVGKYFQSIAMHFMTWVQNNLTTYHKPQSVEETLHEAIILPLS